jgi:hypothetical protein
MTGSETSTPSLLILCASVGLFALLGTTALAVQSDDAPIKVKGRLVVVDAAGTEQPEENGTAHVSIVTDETIFGMATEGGSPSRIFVIDGRFSFEIRKGERLRVDLLDLDHGQARPIANSSQDLVLFNFHSATFREPWPEELVVRARYLPPTRVHFVDAENHSELTGIDVVRQPNPSSDKIYGTPFSTPLSAYPLPYRADDVRLRSASSPLILQVDSETTLPFLQWSERLWGHTPGHCWTPFDVDYEAGGETTVALARSGSLRVRLTGPVPKVSARLVLKPREPGRPSDGDPARAPPDGLVDESEPSLLDWWPVSAEKESRFDGLPPGTYRLELQAGLATGPRYLLGSVAVTIEREKESFAELEAKPVPKLTTPSTIPFAIDLHLDRGWTDEPFVVTLEPSGVSRWSHAEVVRIPRAQLLSNAEAPDHWTSDGLSLAPGTWDLAIDRFRLLRQFRVDAKSHTVGVDVGPPVDVALHLVDARSRAPILVRKIDWHVPARDAAGGRLFAQWPLAAKHHTIRARVPAGPIEIFGENEEIDWSEPVVVNVGVSDRDVDVPLKRLVGIRVRFTLNDEPLEWGKVFRGKPPPDELVVPISWDYAYPDETAVSVLPKGTAADSPSAAKIYESSDEETCLLLPAPGTYVVTFREPARFLPIEAREITIPDERVVEVVIPLQRKE